MWRNANFFQSGNASRRCCTRAGQRALRAAFIGFFVDMFDVYLPVVAWGRPCPTFNPQP